MKYYVIAGERSGDLHGSNLIKEIKKLDAQASFRGFGGDYMKAEGFDLVVHYEEMAFMGFTALVTNAFTIAQKIKQCKNDIEAYQPDVVILIDYGGFNRRIAKFGKEQGIKVFYYIVPKVWAWYTSRALELKKHVDRMFVILPFEKEFFKKYDMEVDYVGNPVLDAIKKFEPDPDFLTKYSISVEKKIIALLPGSRKTELRRMVPVMAEVAKANSDYQFIVAAVKSLPDELYAPFKSISNVKFIFDATYDLLSHADAALVTSGTATLETGLFKVPQVVLYRAGSLEYMALKKLVKVKYISLVNLIADKLVIREMIQDAMNFESINAELLKILKDDTYRNEMLSEYNEIYKILDTGSASENAANLMVGYLTNRNPG